MITLNRFFDKRHTSYKISWWKTVLFLLTCIIFILLLYLYSPFPTYFSVKDIVIGVLIGIMVFFANYLLFYVKLIIYKVKFSCDYSSNHISFISILDSLFSALLIKIGLIIMLASIEEYIFRSFILSFTNDHFSIAISILFNGVVFYLIHFNSKILELIFMGIVFSLITLYTNNMLTAIAAHASNNIFVFFIRRKYILNKY